MSPAPDQGRLLRGGREIARLVLVWALVAVALHLLDLWLADFDMPYWWQPIALAAILGVLSAGVWPLIMRFAPPGAVLVLGLGSFLLLGAGVLAISFAVPDVTVANLETAVIVVVVIAAVSGVVSSLLAIDEDEVFFRRAARRFRRDGTDVADEPPGVLLLQIDGLGYETVRRGIRDGDLPTLSRWLEKGSHVLTDWHCDWSSQTGASVCGLLHGSNDDILGFRWYEKDSDHVMACAHPTDAAEIERRHSDGRGLLANGGAARGGLFTGDADHVSFTMSALSFITKGKRRDTVGAGYYAYFANPINVLRTFGSALVDVLREISASVRQKRAGVRPRVKRGPFFPFARAGTTVIARDLVVSAIIGDMLAGRPVVYADFLGYDEVAHHTGIERFDALAVVRSIDQQIGRLYRAERLSPRRYHLVVLSDHGVTQGAAFTNRFGESIEQLVGRLCGGDPPTNGRRRPPRSAWQLGAAMAEASTGSGPIALALRRRAARTATPDRHRTAEGRPAAVARAAPGVVVVVSGHVAMVSFTEHAGRVDMETIERDFPELLPTLVDHPGVGFMLVRSAESGAVVLGRDGVRRLDVDGPDAVRGTDPLAGYGRHAVDLIRRTDGFAHCPDIVINSDYNEITDDASPFEMHVGSHGGLGGGQSRGFLIYPAELPAPGEIVGAERLHRIVRDWLTRLGHPVPEVGKELVSES